MVTIHLHTMHNSNTSALCHKFSQLLLCISDLSCVDDSLMYWEVDGVRYNCRDYVYLDPCRCLHVSQSCCDTCRQVGESSTFIAAVRNGKHSTAYRINHLQLSNLKQNSQKFCTEVKKMANNGTNGEFVFRSTPPPEIKQELKCIEILHKIR